MLTFTVNGLKLQYRVEQEKKKKKKDQISHLAERIWVVRTVENRWYELMKDFYLVSFAGWVHFYDNPKQVFKNLDQFVCFTINQLTCIAIHFHMANSYHFCIALKSVVQEPR